MFGWRMRTDLISELIDEMIIEKPLPYELIKFDSAKEVAILGAIEQYQNIMENKNLDQASKDISMVTVLAYLTLENMMQWVELHNVKSVKH